MNEVLGTSPAFEVRNADGSGPFLIVCEHASRAIPPEYGTLGLDDAARSSHIAWDPGALAVARGLSTHLDAPLVASRVSRLVYDCNRPPDAPDAMPAKSEIYRVPGNEHLTDEQRASRTQQVYFPFRDALSSALDRHAARVAAPVVATVHSFTPIFHGRSREVEIGLLHDSDARLVDAMLSLANEHAKNLVVRRNEPYGPLDGVTHTLREHALPRGMANVMIEVRNDLIASDASQAAMAASLSIWLKAALELVDRHGEQTTR